MDDTKLAVVLDVAGRFVTAIRLPVTTHKVVGLPYSSIDEMQNERLGLIADRLPKKGRDRVFNRRGEHVMAGGEAILVFKEEGA